VIRIRSRAIRIPAAVLACAASLASCDDNTGPPEARVTTVEVAGGNDQPGTVATTLPELLVARALDAQSRAVQGARVEWQVAAGQGSITPSSTVTDAEGRATAQWTLGPTAGEQIATILVGTLSATFLADAAPGPAVSVTVTPSPVVLDAIAAVATLEVIGRDAHDNQIEGRPASWVSNDPDIVTVNQAGAVTAVSPGTTSVRATLDGASGEAEVSVQPQPAAILVEPQTAQFPAVGATIQFQASARDRNGHPVTVPAQNFAWSSSDPLIVSVNATGLARAEAAGTAQVRAALGAVTGEAQAAVVQAAVSLTVSPRTDTLTTLAPTVQLAVSGVDANGNPIQAPAVAWSSSNIAIATVSPAGLVTGISNGTTRIRATSGTVADSATITVRLNSAPKPSADTIAALMDTQRIVAAPGLLANDTLGIPAGTIASFGGGSLGGTVTSSPAGSTVTFGTGGSLRVNADGSLTFTPSTGFTGTFTFQYRAQNSVGIGDGTVTIHVGLPPTAVDDAYATAVDQPLSVGIPGVLANDDTGFPVAAITSFGGTDIAGSGVTSYAPGQRVAFGFGGFVGGSVQLNADGSLSFTPPTGFTGTISFQYRLTSSTGTSDATITITVN
jgi:uncharacterized protein YjdB